MLTSTIPSELGLLSNHLTIFQAYHNLFSGSLPLEIGSLTSLKEFLVSGNDLTGTLPTTMSSLSELRMLFVSHNPQLQGNTEVLHNLSTLEALDINQTQITIDGLDHGMNYNNTNTSGIVPANIASALKASFWQYYYECNRQFPCTSQPLF